MSPLPKLVWFREQEPKLFESVAHWVGIKDYVLLRMCDALVIDHSMASGTGLMDIHRLAWDAEALQLAGITAEQLPELRADDAVLPGLTRGRGGDRAAGRHPGGGRRRRRPAGQPRARRRRTRAWPPARSAPAARCG